jgi:hypothetical protein
MERNIGGVYLSKPFRIDDNGEIVDLIPRHSIPMPEDSESNAARLMRFRRQAVLLSYSNPQLHCSVSCHVLIAVVVFCKLGGAVSG